MSAEHQLLSYHTQLPIVYLEIIIIIVAEMQNKNHSFKQ